MPDDLILDRYKLRDLRINAGLSQRGFALACVASGHRLTAQAINHLERGRSQPLPNTLAIMAAVLGARLGEPIKPTDLLKSKVAA
jgi:transcriptional regulator with XRE-family HTH domain